MPSDHKKAKKKEASRRGAGSRPASKIDYGQDENTDAQAAGADGPAADAEGDDVQPPAFNPRVPDAPNPRGVITVEDFISKVAPLLDMEREAEIAAAAEVLSGAGGAASAAASGRALLGLRLTDVEGGLLGRTLLMLVSNKGGSGTPLPAHRLSPHDIVRLRPQKADAGTPALAEGVVYRLRDDSVVVAVDELPEEGLDVPLRLEKMANEVTYNRLHATLRALGDAARSGAAAAAVPGGPLLDVLFGGRAPRFAAAPPAWRPVNRGLDASQRAAVSLGLAAADVALIHGPPGTGKTTAVVELILQEVARGSRVLAAAASNVAVDNLVERLAAAPGALRVLRVGHPARLLPQVLEASLEAAVLRSDNSALARDCRKETKALNQRLLKLGRRDWEERRAIRGELRLLAKEERSRQARAVAEALAGAQVVCTTLAGVGARDVAGLQFDVVVIDEAAQALEAACWAALLRGRRAVLAGDHKQLPPTVVSEPAAREGLARTLFERLHDMWGGGASEMLSLQYRMHADIADWSSAEMYAGRLRAHASVAAHTLAGLPGVSPDAPAELLSPLLLIDTAGCGMEETREDSGSVSNAGEAAVAMAHVRRLLRAGVKPTDIGVIAPYSAQVALLRELRPEGVGALLEVSTVDGFQGREKEALVISATRSSTSPAGASSKPGGEQPSSSKAAAATGAKSKSDSAVGFLADARRMNVAVTRARRHCALVCDTDTLRRDPFLARLVAHFEERGEYASAADYGSDGG